MKNDTPANLRARSSRVTRRVRGERGQSLVEFAIVLPVLMLVVLGIIKGGIHYNTRWLT
jgi:Flp pilus assembly protein TadG